MILNEDYFKDLEIEDKDIIEDDNLDVEGPVDFKTYQKYLSTHYSRCIIIVTDFFNNLFHDTVLWKQTIPDMVNRVNRLLDAYSVEHEVVFRDLSGCRGSHVMYSYKVGRCNVLSKYEEYRFFDADSLDNAYIIFYCNMPHFTYKESYYFVDRLQNTLWRTESSTVFDNLKITTSPCDLMNFADLYSYTYGNKEISLSI